MVMLVVTPSLLLPDTSADMTQIVVLLALFAGIFTMFEYASVYPGLVEFRDAPPFNRIRFASLFAMVLLLSVLFRSPADDSTVTQFITAIGALIGKAIDFPYSPVRLIVLLLPEGATVQQFVLLRSAAGLAYLISLMSLAIFMIVLRASNWPHRGGSFNVWVNLPTFDPTAGGDVVERLERDARFNVALGFVLPFVAPPVVKGVTTLFGAISLANDQTLVWILAAWAFLPASLFMRGIAMQQVATMITEERARNAGSETELQPA